MGHPSRSILTALLSQYVWQNARVTSDTERAEADGLLTIDELAAATGLTVRTTRYYATLGLVPPPVRRGRLGYYTPAHRARLDLVKALQDHGFTLSAIEKFMARIPENATPEALSVRKVMLTSWSPRVRERLSFDGLEHRAGRALSPEDVDRLELADAIKQVADDEYDVLPAFEVGVELLDVEVSLANLELTTKTIRKHMDALARDLGSIMVKRVVEPHRSKPHSAAEDAEFERNLARLRQLTLEAVLTGFQHSADQLISRALGKD